MWPSDYTLLGVVFLICSDFLRAVCLNTLVNYDRLYLYIELFAKYDLSCLIVGSNLQCSLAL